MDLKMLKGNSKLKKRRSLIKKIILMKNLIVDLYYKNKILTYSVIIPNKNIENWISCLNSK